MPPPPPEIFELPDGYLIKLPWGYLHFSNNEVTLASTIKERGGDPPKFRLVTAMGGSLGVWSFGVLRDDGVFEEMVILQGKQDERYRNDPNNYSGELTAHVRNHALPGDGMVKTMEMRHDGTWFNNIINGNIQSSPSPIPPSPPSPTPPPPPPPPAAQWPPYVQQFIGVNGKLNFALIKAYYAPIECEDEQNYLDGDMDAKTVIDQMNLRAVPTDPDP